jgi:hypothetical protein
LKGFNLVAATMDDLFKGESRREERNTMLLNRPLARFGGAHPHRQTYA